MLVALMVGKPELGVIPLPLIGPTPKPELPGYVVLFTETGKPEDRVKVSD